MSMTFNKIIETLRALYFNNNITRCIPMLKDEVIR